MTHQTLTGAGPLADAHSQIAMSRVVGSAEAAAFCNYSLAHWLRLTRAGKTPTPVRLSTRKLGWRIGSLVDFVNDARAA